MGTGEIVHIISYKALPGKCEDFEERVQEIGKSRFVAVELSNRLTSNSNLPKKKIHNSSKLVQFQDRYYGRSRMSSFMWRSMFRVDVSE